MYVDCGYWKNWFYFRYYKELTDNENKETKIVDLIIKM